MMTLKAEFIPTSYVYEVQTYVQVIPTSYVYEVQTYVQVIPTSYVYEVQTYGQSLAYRIVWHDTELSICINSNAHLDDFICKVLVQTTFNNLNQQAFCLPWSRKEKYSTRSQCLGGVRRCISAQINVKCIRSSTEREHVDVFYFLKFIVLQLGIPEMIKTSVNKHVDVFYFLKFIVLQLGIPEMIKTSVNKHVDVFYFLKFIVLQLGIPEMIKTSVNKHVDVFYFLKFIVLQLGIPEMIKMSVHEHGTKETSKKKKKDNGIERRIRK
ncbi:hypothetical protein BgiMline_024244 [Biomphalaria glabrata]|nr:hypothetical protein BgiMline_007445 [Biomphalaria glabrata]